MGEYCALWRLNRVFSVSIPIFGGYAYLTLFSEWFGCVVCFFFNSIYVVLSLDLLVVDLR